MTYEAILEAIIIRDKQDSEREEAPLKPADDAVMFINDEHDVQSSAEYIIKLMEKAANKLETK